MAPLVLDQVEDNLSFWEFVNPSDAEYSDDSFSVDSLSDDVISCDSLSSLSSPLSQPPNLPEVEEGDPVVDLDLRDLFDDNHIRDFVENGRGCSWPAILLNCADSGFVTAGAHEYHAYIHDYDVDNNDHGDCDGDGDGDDVDDDLDDELVPRSVSAKLGRQRMRKLGKRLCSKILTSKTSPYSHLKPGCVRGKHGLGMKFRC